MKEDGGFPIIDCYLRLAGSGEKISAFRADEYYWRDLGKANDLQHAAREMEQGVF
jgi:NDP-sugar pyrophosphorylase family protein